MQFVHVIYLLGLCWGGGTSEERGHLSCYHRQAHQGLGGSDGGSLWQDSGEPEEDEHARRDRVRVGPGGRRADEGRGAPQRDRLLHLDRVGRLGRQSSRLQRQRSPGL